MLQLDEEELFGKVKSIDIEQSDILKNLGTLSNMIQEAIDCLKNKDRVLYEDAEQISNIRMEAMKNIGDIIGKIEKYM